MRKLLLTAVSVFIVIIGFSQQMNIASYNVRYDAKEDAKENPWSKRLPHIVNIVTKANLDIFGTQEGLFHQLSDLKRSLKDYEYCGSGRNGGREGEYSSIWYKKDKFTLLASGNFWLSATPDTVSKGWDASLERICTWARFKEKRTGYTFFFFNTHLDHRGAEARKNSIGLIFNRIEKIAGNAPVILSGDFNMHVKDTAYNEFAKYRSFRNAYDVADDLQDRNHGTFNGFDTSYHSDKRIDHIFISNHFNVKSYRLAKDQYNGSNIHQIIFLL
jgi:endonuclease/exonuclease/phosphatase family metal-dependent hydrolase